MFKTFVITAKAENVLRVLQRLASLMTRRQLTAAEMNVAESSLRAESVLYRNGLKNREFDEKGLQNFCSERETTPGSPMTHRHWGGAIAERLRTLENSPGDCFLGKQVNEVNWPEGRTLENSPGDCFLGKQVNEVNWPEGRTLENSPGDCFLGKQVNEVNWPEGGSSENKNFEVNPTKSKTDSSDYFGITLTLHAQEKDVEWLMKQLANFVDLFDLSIERFIL